MASDSHEQIFEFLRHYADQVQAVLSDGLVGVYVYGSLVYGAFDPARSDVDLAILIRSDLTEVQLQALDALHTRLVQENPLAAKLDGTYVPVRYAVEPGGAALTYVREGHFVARGGGDMNAVMWHTLHTRGITVVGPPPADIVPPVSKEALAETMRYNLRYLSQRVLVPGRGDVESQVFGVLSLCRVLYTLRTGDIVSKIDAARWALKQVDGTWRPVVRRALDRYERADFGGTDAVLAKRSSGFADYAGRLAEQETYRP